MHCVSCIVNGLTDCCCSIQTGAIDEVIKWIKEQPYFHSSTKRSCGSNGLDEMAMKMVVQMVNLNQVSGLAVQHLDEVRQFAQNVEPTPTFQDEYNV